MSTRMFHVCYALCNASIWTTRSSHATYELAVQAAKELRTSFLVPDDCYEVRHDGLTVFGPYVVGSRYDRKAWERSDTKAYLAKGHRNIKWKTWPTLGMRIEEDRLSHADDCGKTYAPTLTRYSAGTSDRIMKGTKSEGSGIDPTGLLCKIADGATTLDFGQF